MFVEVLQVLVQQNVSKTEIVSLIRDACIFLHIEDKRVRGLLPTLYWDSAFFKIQIDLNSSIL